MAVTFPRTGGKVEIISSALIDHLKWSRLFQHGSALARHGSYFCSTFTSLEPPADITARALAVREHWHIACETSRGLFSSSIFAPPFQLAHYCLSHFLSVLPAWCSSLSFPLLAVFNLLFHARFTLPPIPLPVHLSSVSSFFIFPLTVSYPVSLPSEATKLSLYASNQWSQCVDVGKTWQTKGTDFFFFFEERQRERDRDRETGRKAQHQQGFSFVKQEVWGTKGQTAWLFQSVPMLSHCFHCHNSRRALYPALLCLSQQNASKKSICRVCIHVSVCTAVKKKKKWDWELVRN